MPRTRRYIFNTITAVSLLLMLMIVAYWIGSSKLPAIGVSPTEKLYLEVYKNGVHGGWIEQWAYGWSRKEFNPKYSALGFEYETANVNTALVEVRISISHWFLTLIFTILPAIGLYKWNKRRKLGPNACPSCGYDLTGNESGECPECGKSVA